MSCFYESFLSLLNAISWPIAAIIIVLLIKPNISSVFKRLQLFKYQDIEIHLLKEINEVSKSVKDLIPKIKTKRDGTKDDTFIQEVSIIAKISPAAAIPFAYSHIENALKREMFPMGIQAERKEIDHRIENMFGNNKDIETYNLLLKLKSINFTVMQNKKHIKRLKEKDAVLYGEIAEMLIDKINEQFEP